MNFYGLLVVEGIYFPRIRNPHGLGYSNSTERRPGSRVAAIYFLQDNHIQPIDGAAFVTRCVDDRQEKTIAAATFTRTVVVADNTCFLPASCRFQRFQGVQAPAFLLYLSYSDKG